MGLSQSLYTGWTGMATHQRSLDNTGNNLANVNTTGFRKSDFMFSNLFNQILNSGGLPASDTTGATNAKTLGMGTTTGAIVHNFTQGPIEVTDNPLDVAISGNGFFLADTGRGTALTRNGSFYLSPTATGGESMLCVGDGYAIQGWNAVDGTITPSTDVSNIVIPAIGGFMPGQRTTRADLDVVLPTNTSSDDFNGKASNNLELKGNLPEGTSSLVAGIHASVTSRSGSAAAVSEVREIKVEITFDGPTPSADGTVNDWSWTMKTIDWPNPGDASIQLYPPLDGSEFTQDTISFYAQGNTDRKTGAGEVVIGAILPGAVKVDATTTGADGVETTSTLSIGSGFTLDVSRLTALAYAPGGGELTVWSVDGNAKGSMARTISVFDEYTDFVETTDDAGNTVIEAVRAIGTREIALRFEKAGADDSGTDWIWSATTGASGALRFDTRGELESSESGGGDIAFNFDGARHINYEALVRLSAQDGHRDGVLKSYSIDQNGKIFGHYSNDMIDPLARIALGTVQNTSGLNGTGGTLFYTGSASGGLIIGIAGSAGDSGLVSIGEGLTPGALEGSNVDLSREFTSLISIERGYQLNGRVISTSDEMLQTALGLKR